MAGRAAGNNLPGRIIVNVLAIRRECRNSKPRVRGRNYLQIAICRELPDPKTSFVRIPQYVSDILPVPRDCTIQSNFAARGQFRNLRSLEWRCSLTKPFFQRIGETCQHNYESG